ncbi:ABSCISIC ACID-INSENSITIVE 5-like protein 2 [Quillaja saponaria]|uniref:ABSCISIC ACID-INSENSITIVE 5-like protein 2 n=1 Tax=Quillaja saponaria TaxID=32244 RepID=A0AAD7LV25_QUISA|nr:ABSCISIC ACID-INSENSITIVE 5-like protein 2 [Quillaja saponaria]
MRLKTNLGDTGKSLESMNLDELPQNVWTAEASKSLGVESENSSSVSFLQHQAILTLDQALNGKTVDDVWIEIQQGHEKRYGEDLKGMDREMTLGETTLEDLFVQVGFLLKLL